MERKSCSRNGYRFSRLFLFLLLLGFTALLPGCSAKINERSLDSLKGLHPSISVSQIPPIEVAEEKLSLSHKPSVSLPQIIDSRASSSAIRYKEREITIQGNSGRLLHYLLSSAFRLRGFDLSKDSAVELRIELSGWQAELEEKRYIASASILAEVLGPGDAVLYSAIYDGIFEKDSPKLLVSDLQKSLGQAMHKALSSLCEDKDLIYVLSAY